MTEMENKDLPMQKQKGEEIKLRGEIRGLHIIYQDMIKIK